MKIVFEEPDLQEIISKELRFNYPLSRFEIKVSFSENGVVANITEKEAEDVAA